MSRLDGDDWIQTSTSGKLYPLRPLPEEINIIDIAKGLAAQPRFSGLTVVETAYVYNVAQHSYLVSQLLDDWGESPRVQLAGLLHDGEEGLGFCDLAGPIKHTPELAGYRDAAKRMQRAILERFGLDPDLPPIVKAADRTVQATEARDLMQPYHPDWCTADWPAPLPDPITPWPARYARNAFLDRFLYLTQACGAAVLP